MHSVCTLVKNKSFMLNLISFIEKCHIFVIQKPISTYIIFCSSFVTMHYSILPLINALVYVKID